jgi:hypothetical protein
LSLGDCFEPSHLPLLLASVLMRDLCAIVLIPSSSMLTRWENVPEEPFSGTLVSALRHQNINHISILVNGTPKIAAFTTDRNEHFINTPAVPEPSLFTAQRSSVGWFKLETQITNRFEGDRDAALGKEILNITGAESESMVKPN